MILPIVAYGDPVLKRKAKDIPKDYPDLQQLIDNMFETMYNAHGVGLAAPQIGKSIRLFIVDASPFAEDDNISKEEKKELKIAKEVFINPTIKNEQGDEWDFNEGCLSIPEVREDVFRQPKIEIEYYDRDFNLKHKTLDGLYARVVQHEYDHIEGVLFTDKLSGLKKRLIKGKLKKISEGKIDVEYRMRFPKLKKNR
ncbi:peptide deformylase [Mesohalobacter halotolerans]|uniref:Peptide deformylase n=1 Tax=Mesohalobacter halotolerans TaxID=1883405 RepID=A0A4U5TRH0_9FLAO|nr:peptide deformylase [Mesohalobacter halotolerans]MBS3738572.1 peptide deformylase [Psychroflexus sp.]TKS56401.1 peptide deformylase [Mesohalobacter halotolerans]